MSSIKYVTSKREEINRDFNFRMLRNEIQLIANALASNQRLLTSSFIAFSAFLLAATFYLPPSQISKYHIRF